MKPQTDTDRFNQRAHESAARIASDWRQQKPAMDHSDTHNAAVFAERARQADLARTAIAQGPICFDDRGGEPYQSYQRFVVAGPDRYAVAQIRIINDRFAIASENFDCQVGPGQFVYLVHDDMTKWPEPTKILQSLGLMPNIPA